MVKVNKPKMSIVRERQVGRSKEFVFEISKPAGQLKMNDVRRIRNKIEREAESKYEYVNVQLTKVLAGQWMTFQSEAKMNQYFESKVADPSKFFEFERMHVYIHVE